jgi:large subunit ribosomal protein L28
MKGKLLMAKICEICGKRSSTGNMVSKSGRRTKRKWLPNLQRIKININGQIKKAHICTRCIRSNKIRKAT